MSKKGRIISWIIIFALAVAVVAVVTTQLMKGGASKIDRTTFQQYVENAQYYVEEGEIYSRLDESHTAIKLEGYKVKDGAIVTDNDKETSIIVIWKIATSNYEYSGYTKNSNGAYVRSYYCFGPSSYQIQSWDSETFVRWQGWGVIIDQADPNAGSWVSTAFSVLMLIIVCVVFFLIIRSSMGGAGKVMSFAKTKARISTNIKVRFTDVAGAEEEKVELAEIVEFLRQPKKFSDQRHGAHRPLAHHP